MLRRKRVIKFADEGATPGTKVAGTTELMAFDPQVSIEADFSERISTGHQLGQTLSGTVGPKSCKLTFECELAGTGSGGLNAGLAILLQACGFKQTAEVYNLHSDVSAHDSLSFDVFDDGKKKEIAGAVGNVVFEGETGQIIRLKFEFTGRWVQETDVSLPTYVPSAEAGLRLASGTFTLDAVPTKIGKFSLAIGNVIAPALDPNAAEGIACYQIRDYDPVVSMDPEEVLVATYDYTGKWAAATAAVLSLVVGGGSQDTATFAIPVLQYKDIKESERDKLSVYEINAQCLHSSGDDAVTLTMTAGS